MTDVKEMSMTDQRITPNGGDNPCACGFIHPCCRYLVDGKCPHKTPGDHHHAPSRATLTDVEKLVAIRRLAESWHKGYGVTPPPCVDDMEVAYDDAGYQILHVLNDETTDFYGRPWSPVGNLT